MRIEYTRRYYVNIPDDVLLEGLAQRIDEWDYGDDTPDDARTMGVADLMYWLDREGYLDDTDEVEDADAELVDDQFRQDFYTVDQLRSELADVDAATD